MCAPTQSRVNTSPVLTAGLQGSLTDQDRNGLFSILSYMNKRCRTWVRPNRDGGRLLSVTNRNVLGRAAYLGLLLRTVCRDISGCSNVELEPTASPPSYPDGKNGRSNANRVGESTGGHAVLNLVQSRSSKYQEPRKRQRGNHEAEIMGPGYRHRYLHPAYMRWYIQLRGTTYP